LPLDRSEALLAPWRTSIGPLQPAECQGDAKRLRLVEDESRKLKKLLADHAIDMMVLKDLLAQERRAGRSKSLLGLLFAKL
jgi:hypothetical protein